jgi:hypothetical protein
MELVQLYEHKPTQQGLQKMLKHYLGPKVTIARVAIFLSVPDALLIVEIAKRADDRPEWFPSGKWATILAIEQRIADEIVRTMNEAEER